eukprot:Gb_07349 [translate_table: standard]
MAMYKKIYRGEFNCPQWFSGVCRLISKLLDSNPKTFFIRQLMEVPWFKKGFKHVKFNTEDDDISNLDDVDYVFNASVDNHDSTKKKPKDLGRKPTCLNAFDIISFSRDFDLSGLFEENDKLK